MAADTSSHDEFRFTTAYIRMSIIMNAVARGKKNSEIAELVGRSSGWVEKRLQEIYAALNCKSKTPHTKRAEAVARAMRVGVIT